MRINTKATNIEMTEAISDYLEKRLAALDKFLSNDESAIVDVEVARTTRHHNAGDIFRAEINIHAKNKHLRAASEMSDLYAAIDDAQNEIVRELRSRKERSFDLVRKGGQKIKDIIRGFYKKNK
jgi:ribosomal subunit interface protein